MQNGAPLANSLFTQTVVRNRRYIMLDRDKIPGDSYIELIALFGAIRAEEIADREMYNFVAIQKIILNEKIKRKYQKSNLRWYILKWKAQTLLFFQKNRVLIIYACILSAILVTVYKILD